jgi:hypothetical protein
MRTLTVIAAALTLCACGESAGDKPDFGAAMVARAAVKADRACAAAGFETLEDCADAPSKEVRLLAKTALDAQNTYNRLCAADLGRDRCDDMLQMAYFMAQK